MSVSTSSYTFDDPLPGRRSGVTKSFDKETLSRLRQRLPEYLAAVGINLRRRGSRLVASCPSHEDHEPSFAVFGEGLSTCGCYPCGFSGDAFATSLWLGRATSFPEAVQDVAGALGESLRDQPARSRPARQAVPLLAPKAAFVLSGVDRRKIDAARLAFSDAFWGEDEIVDRIVKQLGLDRETLRLAAWGSCGLGLANGWLCYAYPSGLKWRNPDTMTKPRFRWLVGKATAPWRMDWVKPEINTVYLTEGESDTLAMMAAGIGIHGEAVCVASPGTSFPRSWAPLFDGKKVVLCFDRDHAGERATATVAEILKGHASEILRWKGASSHE